MAESPISIGCRLGARLETEGFCSKSLSTVFSDRGFVISLERHNVSVVERRGTSGESKPGNEEACAQMLHKHY